MHPNVIFCATLLRVGRRRSRSHIIIELLTEVQVTCLPTSGSPVTSCHRHIRTCLTVVHGHLRCPLNWSLTIHVGRYLPSTCCVDARGRRSWQRGNYLGISHRDFMHHYHPHQLFNRPCRCILFLSADCLPLPYFELCWCESLLVLWVFCTQLEVKSLKPCWIKEKSRHYICMHECMHALREEPL